MAASVVAHVNLRVIRDVVSFVMVIIMLRKFHVTYRATSQDEVRGAFFGQATK